MTTQTEARGDAQPRSPSARAGQLSTVFALGALSVAFFAFASQYAPRLTNNVWSDVEFSGWVAALAQRLQKGARFYEDLILPIPPGSIWLLAQIEGIAGPSRMLTEAWACAICHLLMALSAYAIAAPFTRPRSALFVSGATLALVLQLPKELLYDHTAQVVSWASIALLARGLVSSAPRRDLWFSAAGLVAGLVCVFKQSTSVGAIGGGGVAIAYLALVARKQAKPNALREGLVSLVFFGCGVALGLALTVGFVAGIGGSVAGFFQTVFTDGSALKGGWKVLLPRMLGYTTVAPTVSLPLLFVVIAGLLAFRIARQGGGLGAFARAGEEEDSWLSSKEAASVALLTTLAFGGGALFLASGIEPGRYLLLPGRIVYALAGYLPSLGLVFGALFALASLSYGGERRSHALSALLLAAVVAAIGHNGSVREARFFYDNNVIVAVGLLCLFVAIDRANLRHLSIVAYAIVVFSIFGGKMERFVIATHPVTDGGFFSGMKVNPRGEKILEAAARVRELTSEDETVLVLPEDVSLAALIGRDRPKLCGAILFVDQYPSRCLAEDLAEIEKNPPKVIVAYPSQEADWQRMYRLWSSQSPAGFLNRAVFRHHIPARYRLDSTFPSVFWGGTSSLEVYVRNDGPIAPVR